MAIAPAPVGSLVACMLMPPGRPADGRHRESLRALGALAGAPPSAAVSYFAPRPTATGASTPARSVSRRKKNSVTSTRVIGTSEK